MTQSEETLPLAADFPPATREDWRKLVDAVLKGAPFERLRSTTYDGIGIEPLAARRADARPVAGRPDAPWQVLSRIDHPDPALANEAARHELANGASGLSLVFAGAVGDYGFALPASAEALARTIEEIDLASGLVIELDLSPHAEAAIDAALAKGLLQPPPMPSPAGSSARKPGNLRIGHDPLGAMAVTGGAAARWKETAPRFARRLAALMRAGLDGRLAVADGRVIHNAGGSEAQELAFVLGVALAYLRALESEGVALQAARGMIFFRLAADAEQFLTLAKFRALRKLWARVEQSCNLEAEPAFVSAETAWRMMAQRDPQVNILRATIAVFSAALGGADAITVLPFTAARRLPDRFARRVARNTQLVLLEESHLDRVADPAAGSGTVEDLTDQLCRTAWALLQQIEAAGGIAAALEGGLIQDKVASVRAKRAAAVARRQDAVTGVSIFPNLHEPTAALGASADRDEKPLPGAPGRGRKKDFVFAPLAPIRSAQPFEALRDASDRFLATSGTRPTVFLATLGAPAAFTARASFAKNFFEAGGIEAIGGENLDLPALLAAYKTSGAALVCLCSTDKVYEEEAPPAAAAFKAAGAQHIYLAGRPGEREAGLRAAGVQSFIYEGCDAQTVLNAAYNVLGIAIG